MAHWLAAMSLATPCQIKGDGHDPSSPDAA
jgi:hypothetical protein